MKKMITKYLVMFSMLLFASLAVTSCSNDKDDPEDPEVPSNSPAAQLIGTWVGSEEGETITLKFKSDGTGNWIYEPYDETDIDYFRWTAIDDTIVFKYDEDNIQTYFYIITDGGRTLYLDESVFKKQ